jgi:hypothetical protein
VARGPSPCSSPTWSRGRPGGRSNCPQVARALRTVTVAREITQRELRNDSGEVMRALDLGESFVVTRNGVPLESWCRCDEGGSLLLAPPSLPLPALPGSMPVGCDGRSMR